MDIVLREETASLRKRFAEHGEAALRFVLHRLVLHDVPVLRQASCLEVDDVHDDPCRPPTAAEAAVNHDHLLIQISCHRYEPRSRQIAAAQFSTGDERTIFP